MGRNGQNPVLDGTTVEYNGVKMFSVLTKDFNEEVLYDSSGADAIGHKFRMRFQGMVHSTPDAYAIINGNPLPPVQISTNQTISAVTNEITLRRLLMEPRCHLKVYSGGAILLEARQALPADGNEVLAIADVNNGPKPIALSITKITGARTYQVEFTIECSVVDCATLNNSSGVLSNRWAMVDNFDENWYSTRTISGIMRLKSSLLNPLFLRGIVIPQLQAGFKRERIECTATADGLNLQYSVVDRQVYAAAPYPATSWNATHSVYSGEGSVMYGEINVSVTGPPSADRVDLIGLASAIAQRKLLIDATGTHLVNARLVDHLHDNHVELTATVMYNKGEDAAYVFASKVIGLGKHLDEPMSVADGALPYLNEYNHNRSRVPKVFDEATPAGLLVSYLQSPCNSTHGMPQVTSTEPGQEEEGEGEDWQPFTFEGEVPTANVDGNYDQSNAENIYTHYRVDVRYSAHENVAQLPIARSPSVSGNPLFASDATCVFVTLAQPVARRVVRVEAERYGDWPAKPAIQRVTTIGSLVIRLLGKTEVPKAPKIMADGETMLYSFDAEYVFGLSREPLPGTEEYQVGRLPWISESKAPIYMPSETAVDGIMDRGGAY